MQEVRKLKCWNCNRAPRCLENRTRGGVYEGIQVWRCTNDIRNGGTMTQKCISYDICETCMDDIIENGFGDGIVAADSASEED